MACKLCGDSEVEDNEVCSTCTEMLEYQLENVEEDNTRKELMEILGY